MSEGFLLDNTYGGRLVASWVSGPPEKGMWNGIKVKDRRQLPVRADRCGSCGYLELYAVEAG